MGLTPPSRRGAQPTAWAGLPTGCTVVVDTAPWIYVLEGHPQFAPRFRGLFEAAARQELLLAITSVTLAEVLVGPLRAGQEALAQQFERLLRAWPVIALDADLAVQAARLRAQHGLKLADATQLAAALSINATALVTHDRDFAGITALRVVTGP
jgi:predicted nucleic acid-binding protein